jgi:hypothetical protein
VVVHTGDVLPHKIGPFYELVGLDVIVVHRLLKNFVAADQYLLMTDDAIGLLPVSVDLDTTEIEEEYDVGTVNSHVYFPPIESDYMPDPSEPFSQSTVAVEILRHEIR